MTTTKPITFGFLLLPGFPMSCLTSAIEPLRVANEITERLVFDWQLLSEDGGPVRSSARVGFDADRGDKITLKSLPFEPVLLQGSEAGGGLFQMSNIDVLSFIQIGLLALVSLILGLFVLRPILATAPEALPAPDSPLALNALPAGEGASPSSEASLVVDGSIPGAIEKQETAGERLRELISGRQDETIEILRSWMDEGEEKA